MPTKSPQNRPNTPRSKTQTTLRAVTQPPAAPTEPEPEPRTAAPLTEAQIATRAYEIWQRRGSPMGQDTQHDWYAARAELERERT